MFVLWELRSEAILKIIIMKTTLVLGASINSERYSNRAIQQLKQNGHKVVAVGNREGETHGVVITKEFPIIDIDTITIYLGQANQCSYYDVILKIKPNRIIFNPGAENRELAELANNNGIEVIEACTLVMLSIGNY